MLNAAGCDFNESDFYLDTGDGRRIIIIPPEDIWNQSHTQPLRVYGAYTVANVPYPKGSKGNELCNGKIKCDWIKPHEVLFTQKIGKIPLNRDNVSNYNAQNYIPPLAPELFQYFDVNRISQMFKWERADLISAQVSLDLPLRPGPNNGAGRTLRVEKTYEGDNIIAVLLPQFHIEIWPNFTAPDWKFYYLLVLHRQKHTWQFEPVPGAAVMGQIITDSFTKWRLASFPKAIKCSFGGVDCCGHILLSIPPTPTPTPTPTSTSTPTTTSTSPPPTTTPNPDPNSKSTDSAGARTWWVGIDFGTVNTTVFYRDKDDPPAINGTVHAEPLRFPSRCVPITTLSEADRVISVACDFFPPSDIDDGRFFSCFLRRVISPAPEPILHGVIPYLHVNNAVRILDVQPLTENLKWTEDATLRQMIQLYLHQLAIMIMAEARAAGVSKVYLRWTYPSAFPRSWADQMAGIWQRIAESTGIDINTPDGLTESFADCKYIVKMDLAPAGAQYPCVIADIGGGTTDLAVWEQGELKAQASLELAGRDILPFIQKDEVINNFLKIVGTTRAGFDRLPATYLNALLKFWEGKVNDCLLHHAAEPAFIKLRTALAIVFGGLVYYAGLLIKKLNRASAPQVWFCFGGNGSRYRRWIAGDAGVQNFLTDVIRRALGNNEINVTVKASQEPKAESGKGSLYNYTIALGAAGVGLLWGADGIEIAGISYNWDADAEQIISELREHKVYKLADESMVQLSSLIDVLNAHADKNHLGINQVELTDKLRHTIIADCQSHIQLEIINPKNDADVKKQPLLIKQIKSLLRGLYE